MRVNINDLRVKRAEAEDRRAVVGKAMQAAAESGGTAFEKAVADFDTLDAVVRRLDGEIRATEVAERKSAASAVPRQHPTGSLADFPANHRPAGGMVFQTSDGREVRSLSKSERMADHVVEPFQQADEIGIGAIVRALAVGPRNAREKSALAAGSYAAGGFLIPQNTGAQIIDLARAQARVVQAGAQTLPIEGGNLRLAKQLTDPVPGWRAENGAIADGEVSFGEIVLAPKSLGCIVKISLELLQDAPNVDAVVQGALMQALGLEIDRVALYGSGVNAEPRGLKNRGGVNAISMGTNGAALANYAQFLRAVRLIEDANGPSEGLSAIMAPRTREEIDGLVDLQGQPLQAPETFRNLAKFSTTQVPVNLTQGSATNASEVFVGDFGQLIFGVSGGIQIEISRDAADANGSAFRDGQVWIRAMARVDIGVLREPWLARIAGIIPA